MADPSMAASAKDYTKSTARGGRAVLEHVDKKRACRNNGRASMPCRFKQGEGKGVFPLMAQGQVQGELLGKGGGGAAQMVKRGPALLPQHLNVAQRKAARGPPRLP